MEDNLASSSSTQPEQTDEVARVLDEVQIARNVINQCKAVDAKLDIEYYTRVKMTKEINGLFKKNSSTFSDWLNEHSIQQEKRIRITYENLRKLIYTEYLDKLRIPIRGRLLANLKSTNKNLTLNMLDHDLKYHGFFWKRLGNNKYAIIEKADGAAKRARYLYEMRQVREDNKAIVYVEVHTANIDVDTADCDVIKQIEVDIALAVSPQVGLIDVLVKEANDSSITIDSWLNDKLSGLPEDTVFVIETFSELIGELNVPDKHSKKSDMIEWLNKNNVPFFATSHRGELIALIEMYNGRHQAKIDSFKLLLAKNYKVIFRPRQLYYMRFLKFLESRLYSVIEVADFDKLKDECLKVLNEVDHKQWGKKEREIAIFEMTMSEEDAKLELVIDKLMDSIQNKSLDISEFKDCEEDRIDDYYIDNILIK